MNKMTLIMLLVAGACKSGDKVQAIKLDKLKLQMDARGDVKVEDGLGPNRVMVSQRHGLSIEVSLAELETTLEDEKASVSAIHQPTNVKTDTLPDGWAMTFEANDASGGKNYNVEVERKIGGKPYKCSSVVGNASDAEAGLAACKTLRPL